MPTARKMRRTEPLSFEQVAEQKIRSTLEEYRAAVHRQAAGDNLTAPELDRVAELLDVLRLPELAWGQHVQAVREVAEARAERAKIEAVLDAEAAEGRALAGEVVQLRKRLEEIGLRQKTLARTPHRLSEQFRRENEAAQLFPEVVLDIDEAVAVRRRQATAAAAAAAPAPAAVAAAAENPNVGWSF